MNTLTDRDFCAALVLSLGHFLWQGLFVAAVTAIVVRRPKTARGRYAVLVAALGLMAVCPLLTLAVVTVWGERANPPPVVASAPNPLVAQPAIDVPHNTAFSAETDSHPKSMPQPIAADVTSPTAEPPAAAKEAAGTPVPPGESSWQRFAPLMTDVYLLGVMAMLLRLTVGLWGGWQLRRRSIPVTDAALLQALQRQAVSLGMKFVPMLAYCERVAVPTVIGILKPTILLPLALTSGLALEQVEAVLAHELAHLRRYDHLVNLLQRVIESLLFFHPAVWWLSHKIRLEREHCCDDLVVACGALPLDYAKSLLRVAELSRGAKLHRSVSAVSLLATGQPSTLRQRIARLLGDSAAPQVRLAHSLLVFCLGATCCLLAWVVTTIGWQLAAEAMADHSHSTVVVEWSVIVDEDIAAQVRKLSTDPGQSRSESGELAVIHVDAESLRKLIAGRKDDTRRFQVNRNVFWMKSLAPSWRHTGMSHFASGIGFFGAEPEQYQASWRAFARYFLEQKNNQAHLTVDFQLSGSVNPVPSSTPVLMGNTHDTRSLD
jgi:beta-lactamase regulating signal transducer with metallopeptidase domain